MLVSRERPAIAQTEEPSRAASPPPRNLGVRRSAGQKVVSRALFENTTAGIADIDARTGRFLAANLRYCQIAGRSRAELLGGLTVGDVLHPEDERVPISVAEARGDAERRYVRPDGQIVWVWISVAVTERDPAGNALRISAVVQDVTASHAAQEKLRASEALLRLSLEIGQVGSFNRDLVTGHIQCGKETRAMHGFTPGEQPIPSEVWLGMVLPDDRKELLALVGRAIAERRASLKYEYRFRHPSTGQIRHIEVRTRYEYDGTGQPLTSLGAIIDVTERREAEARISHLAYYDTLTDLPNRVLFRQRLEAALTRAEGCGEVAVLYLDLDGFKEVNDIHGHSAGDNLLRDVAARLRSATDDGAMISRLGGDEFAVLSPRRRISAVAALAGRLLDALSLPFTVDGTLVRIGTSIGISVAPADGTGVDEILRTADLALYEAKADGRGCARFYQPSMSERLRKRQSLESDLRSALSTGQFEVHYQPILDAGTLAAVALEALLRWRHPERGMIPPDEFIPLAEEIGLIVQIGELVLGRACADAARWPGELRVAVNLSAVQFASGDLVGTISSALRNSGLDPRRLELEITETIMLEDTIANLATLRLIKALGVRVALDDFGAGYSSLSYLRSFPFDKVKVDRSFARDLGRSPQADAIMAAVLDLCAALGMTSTVEGVETAEQLRMLVGRHSVEVQGFLFSRAVPADQVAGVLTDLRSERSRARVVAP